MTKHKHANLIHAWADGAEIQYETSWGEWKDVSHPQWMETDTYRIKPEEKKSVVRWLWAYQDVNSLWKITDHMYTEFDNFGKTKVIKLEWSRTEFPE